MKKICLKVRTKSKTKVHNIFNDQKCELHDCLRRHMNFFRWAGFFPVEGLRNPSVQRLRFKLKSFYGIYYFATFLGQAALTTLSAIWCFADNNYSSRSVTILFFYFMALIIMLTMLELAKRWPIFLKRVAQIEGQLGDLRRDNNVRKQCDYMIWFIGVVCLVEHLLSILFYYRLLWNCNVFQKLSNNNFEQYLTYSVPYLFQYTTFAPWKMVIFKILNIQTLILWGVTDVLPMCISLYLISYFRDLNAVIKTRTKKDARFWEKHRLQYTRLDQLVSLVDEHMKIMVLFSFFNYLFFIAMHLFFLLNSHLVKFRQCSPEISNANSMERVTYYLFSSMFIIARALTMSLLAANVHIEAKKPLLTLYDISKEDENKEIQRFRLQLVYNPITLTGSFFPVTRSSILKFVNTIITYELVLLQLSKNLKLNRTPLFISSHQNFTNGSLYNVLN